MQLCAQGAPHKQTYALKFKIEGVGCGWVDGVGRESHESIKGKREIHASKPSVLYASHSPWSPPELWLWLEMKQTALGTRVQLGLAATLYQPDELQMGGIIQSNSIYGVIQSNIIYMCWEHSQSGWSFLQEVLLLPWCFLRFCAYSGVWSPNFSLLVSERACHSDRTERLE